MVAYFCRLVGGQDSPETRILRRRGADTALYIVTKRYPVDLSQSSINAFYQSIFHILYNFDFVNIAPKNILLRQGMKDS